MLEDHSTLDKLHEEIDAELILEDIVHTDQERMIHSVQNVFLHAEVRQHVLLYNKVLPDTLHGEKLARRGILDQKDFAERALPNHLYDLEVFEVGTLFVSVEQTDGLPCNLDGDLGIDLIRAHADVLHFFLCLRSLESCDRICFCIAFFFKKF